jgi:predicted O-methyltransferase YrrM
MNFSLQSLRFNTLHFLFWKMGLAPADTQTTEAERAALARYAGDSRRLVEIGVWHGVTTTILRRAMAADAILFAVDPFFPGRLGFSVQKLIAHGEVNRQNKGTVRWLETTGVGAAEVLRTAGEDPIDFIFIDGDHSYEGLKADWEAWRPLIARGGTVALHDSRSTATRSIDGAGSVRFTAEVIKNDSDFRVVDEIDSLTVLRRAT